MFCALPRFTLTLSRAPLRQGSRFLLGRFPLFLGLVFGLGGCQARPVARAMPLTPARSLTGSSAAIEHLQSSPLY